MRQRSKVLLASAALLLAGCASQSAVQAPMESVPAPVLKSVQALDRALLRAAGFMECNPDVGPFRGRVGKNVVESRDLLIYLAWRGGWTPGRGARPSGRSALS